jgi:hypothetical protein
VHQSAGAIAKTGRLQSTTADAVFTKIRSRPFLPNIGEHPYQVLLPLLFPIRASPEL